MRTKQKEYPDRSTSKTMTSKDFRPRHWIIAVSLGCLVLFWLLSNALLTYDYPMDPAGADLLDLRISALEIITMIGMGISVLGFFACLVVYAVQWLVTIISLWIPPPSRVEHA